MARLCILVKVVRVRSFRSRRKELPIDLLVFLKLLNLYLLLCGTLVEVNHDVHFERVEYEEPSVSYGKHEKYHT